MGQNGAYLTLKKHWKSNGTKRMTTTTKKIVATIVPPFAFVAVVTLLCGRQLPLNWKLYRLFFNLIIQRL